MVALGGQSDPTVATATYHNPCEIDLDFGNVPIGWVDSATVEVKNVGTSALDLSQGTPDSDQEFSLSSQNPQQTVQPSNLANFIATFRPDKVGQASSTFTIQTDGWNSQCSAATGGSWPQDIVTVRLAGNGVQLSLVVQPDAVDFGNTLINTTVKKGVMLINKSTAPVTGIKATVIGGDANLFVVNNAPGTLGPGDSATVDISYSPLAFETRSLASVEFGGSDGEKTSLNLFGEPVGVALTIAPNPCDFGFVPLNTTGVCCTTVTNQANVPVQITGASDFASEGGAFALATTDDSTPPSPQSPIDIPGGASAQVCFSLTPPITQQYSGQVTLITTDPSGTNPVMQLAGWGGGPQISCAPMSIDFGQTLDQSITTVPVLCTNTGTAIPVTNLILEPPTASPSMFSAQFDQTKDVYPLNGLAPGQSAQIDVSYAPTDTAGDKGTLFLRSNGGKGKTLEIPLSGQGLDVPPCQFVVSPSQLDFGNVQLGDTSQALSFEVQNVGTDACLVQGVGIDYDPAGAFQILSTSIQPDPTTGEIVIPPSVAGGASGLIVALEFAPTVQAKSFAAEAAFEISDPADPHQVALLTGSSEPTCLVIAPPALNLGDVAETGMLCTNASRDFKIFNACSTPATIHSITVQSGPADLAQQFSVSAGESLPFTLAPGDAAALCDVSFEPSTLGTHTAEVLVSDGNVETLLPVTGQAVSTGTVSETFVVTPARADILFIMDVDGDAVDQARIAGEMPAFLAAAGQIDYRLAITTDNDLPADPTAELGRLLPCPGCSVDGLAPTIVLPSSVPDGGSAPDPQWPGAFASVWTSAIAAHTHYSLTGKPSQGQTGIVVMVNGTVLSQLAAPGEPNWTYQSSVDAIVFNPSVYSPMTDDTITVTYPIGCQ